jgi:branched-chain amino acid transport system permease protein
MIANLTKRLNTGIAPYIFIPVWMLVTLIGLLAINRTMFWFPLFSSVLFPLFLLTPLFAFSAQIRQHWKIGFGVVIAFALIPLLGFKDGLYLELVTQIGIFAALALGLNIVIGFAGLLDLGYIAFFAVGAYLWGIFTTANTDTFMRANGIVPPDWSFYLFIFGGIALASLAGILLGLPVLRLKGDYLAIVTLGFGEIIRVLATNLDHPINLTNGSKGLERVTQPPLPQFIFDFMQSIVPGLEQTFGHTINPQKQTYDIFYYVMVLLIIGLVVLIVTRLENSPIGRAWNAIREDEIAAIAMGVPLVRMKLLAFAIGAAFAGAMGVVFAAKQTFVGQESFKFEQSIAILAMVIVGGMGSIRGVIVGAGLVVLLDKQILSNMSQLIEAMRRDNVTIPIINWSMKNWPNQLAPTNFQRFIFGLLLILMVIFRTEGLLPARRRHVQLPDAPPAPAAGD